MNDPITKPCPFCGPDGTITFQRGWLGDIGSETVSSIRHRCNSGNRILETVGQTIGEAARKWDELIDDLERLRKP